MPRIPAHSSPNPNTRFSELLSRAPIRVHSTQRNQKRSHRKNARRGRLRTRNGHLNARRHSQATRQQKSVKQIRRSRAISWLARPRSDESRPSHAGSLEWIAKRRLCFRNLPWPAHAAEETGTRNARRRIQAAPDTSGAGHTRRRTRTGPNTRAGPDTRRAGYTQRRIHAAPDTQRREQPNPAATNPPQPSQNEATKVVEPTTARAKLAQPIEAHRGKLPLR